MTKQKSRSTHKRQAAFCCFRFNTTRSRPRPAGQQDDPMSSLTLYSNPMSRGRIARWMLEEIGHPFDVQIVEYGDAMKSPAYLKINPMGKVPALVHNSMVVTECAAICTYLADAFPDAGMAPDPTSLARGAYFRWMFFATGPLESAIVNTSFGFKLPDAPEEAGRAGWGTYGIVADTLETTLSDGRDTITGNPFSAADLYLCAQIDWGLQFSTHLDRPLIRSYVERHVNRPAALRAQKADKAAQ